MSTRSVLLAALALALASTACQPPAQEAAGLTDEDVAAINTMVEEVQTAELAGDWEVVSGFLTEDFVYFPSNLPMMETRATWLSWVETLGISMQELTFTPVKIEGRGDLAYLAGTISEVYTVGDSEEPIETAAKFVWILEKQADGSWLIDLAIWNTDVPMPALESET
ncbi:MAG: nuclear transport factor 2 family protein [Gemmatimonadota bacterium]|nr:MAG: nuclear transport factor 2 family protein [Gemmatimonadota bacterium]